MTPNELLAFWGTRDPKTELKKAGLMATVGLILAFIAPYDTSDMPSGIWRVIYWVSLLLFGSVLTGPVARWCFPFLTPRFPSSGFLLVAYCMILSIPIFIVVVGLDIYFHAVRFNDSAPSFDYALKFLTNSELTSFDLAVWYFQVAIITCMANGAISAFVHLTQPRPETGKIGPPPGYLFLKRLPPKLGQNLLCLQMEDHYIRAYTEKGDTLVRMRLKDAVAELEGYGGLQVHRSWWVVLKATESVKRDGRRHMIHLKNGMQVPVSKTYADTLKEAGYL